MGLDEITDIMLDRRYWPGGARAQSWRIFKMQVPVCLVGLGFASGRVTKDQSLCCSQSGVAALQNDETSTVEKTVSGESVLEVWP